MSSIIKQIKYCCFFESNILKHFNTKDLVQSDLQNKGNLLSDVLHSLLIYKI